MKKTVFLFLFSIFVSQNKFWAQTNETDSLYAVFNNSTFPDTVRLKAIDDLAWSYNSNKPDSAILFGEQEVQLALEKKNRKFLALAYSTIGISNINKNNYPKALEYDLKALKINEELNDKRRIAVSYANIGNVYNYQNNYTKALEYYFKALNKQEEIRQSNGDKGDKAIQTSCYGNIGTIYQSQKKYEKAIAYQFKALKIAEEIGDDYGKINCYANLGLCYTMLDNYPKGFEYYNLQLKMAKGINYKKAIGSAYSNMASLYNDVKDFKNGIIYIDSAMQISKEIGDLDLQKLSYGHLASAYSALGNYKEAFDNEVKFKTLNDSIYNIDNSNQLSDLKTNFEVERKAIELNAIAKAERKKQNLIILFVVIGLLFVIIFAAFVFRSLRITRKQKDVIEQKEKETQKQKLIVDEKQKEITDSINYAKRIQYSLLAHQDLLNENLHEHFVLFLPKDIVSGDFFWATKKGDSFYLAISDCTGHGVPGAFMSLLNISYLNEAIVEKNIEQPNEVFNFVRNKLIQNKEGGKDGMDATLIRFENNKITYASANHKPLLLQGVSLKDLEADKMPIGKGEQTAPFTLFELTTEKGDLLYFFTDGYVDQFSGETGGKKLTRKRFKELLLTIQNKSLPEQGEVLNQYINDYRKGIEQIDDILVMGIKV